MKPPLKDFINEKLQDFEDHDMVTAFTIRFWISQWDAICDCDVEEIDLGFIVIKQCKKCGR